MKFPSRTFAVAALAALLSVPSAFAQAGDVAVDKTGPGEASSDTDVTYTITVANISANPVSTVTLSDNIPPGMTFVSAAQTGGTPAFVCTNPGVGNNGPVSCTTATMLAGESATFTFVFHIAPMTPPGTAFTNVATVTTQPADANEENNSSTAVTSTPIGDLAVGKTGPAQASADTDVSYTITVTNVGSDPVGTVTLSDNIPPGMTFVSAAQTGGAPAFMCTDPGVGNNGLVSCTTATMLGGQSATFTFVFHIAPMTPPGTDFTNIATVSTAPPDDNEENNSATVVTSTPLPPQSDLAVDKSGPSTAGPDTDVVYTIVVANNGAAASGPLTVSDTLPGTMTFVSLMQSGAALNCTTPAIGAGGMISCTSPGFAPGDTTILTLTGHVPSQTASGTEFNNVVTVTTTNDPNSENDVAVTTATVSAVDMSVVKSGAPPTVAAGTNISYTITIANGGPDPASNAAFFDQLPPGTTFVSFTQTNGLLASSCSTPNPGENGTVSCGWLVFSSGASAEFTLVINSGTATTVQNTAVVTTDSFDTNDGNDQSTVTTTVTQSADVTISKSGPATVTPGTNVSYTITATNNGPSHAQNVSFADPFPPNTTFVSASTAAGFNCTFSSPITCTIATLNAGASGTFTFVFAVAPNATGLLDNTANIDTATADPNGLNDTSTTTATLTPSADVNIVKNGPAAVTPGANATYTITVTNGGPSDASNVAWSDTLPANTTFVSLTQNSGPMFSCTTGPVINCSIATLTPSASGVFTLVVAVSPALANGATVQNTAQVSTTTTDPNGTNNTSTTTATAGASADLIVTKTGPATANAAQTITYAITLTNSGPSDAQNVVLTDNIPAQTTFNSFAQNSGPGFTCATPAPGATGTINCTLATMTAATTATFTLVLNVGAGATGTITNSASASSSTAEAVPGNNTGTSAPAPAIGGGADVGITKTVSGAPFFANGLAQFDISVTNNGPDIASGTTVTDVLPAGTTLVSYTSTQGTCSGTTTVTCTVGTLAVGGSASISLTVRLPGTEGPLMNTATVTTSNPDPNGGNNASTAAIVLGPAVGNIPTLSPLMLLLCAASLALTGWLVTRNT